MILLTIMPMRRLARFVGDVWQETRRLRQALPGPTEE